MKEKEFENILDECLERILLKGESLEQCLKRYPEQADELKPLLETVLATKEASAIKPRPEFKTKARYQFRAALGEKTAPKRRHFFGWLPQWATALAIVLVVLLAGGGTVAAASNSMPDSILYPVKLATENVRLAFTPSQLGKARLCAGFADERVVEIVYMAEKGDAEKVEATTARLDDRLETLAVLVGKIEAGEDSGGAMLTTAGDDSPDSPVSEGDSDSSVGQYGQDNGNGDSPGPNGTNGASPGPDESNGGKPEPPVNFDGEAPVEPVEIIEEQGSIWWRGENANLDNQTRFRIRVMNAATTNPAVLKALLDDVPQSVREALLEAIAVSEDGYEAVLQALQ